MSLTKFLRIINNSIIKKFVDKRVSVLKNTNPQRIFVENIRSFYNMPYSVAKMFCEMAVRSGLFRKKIGVVCPHSNCGRIVMVVDSEEEIPSVLNCEVCEGLEREGAEFRPTKKDIITFYQLIKHEVATN